jgi:hypothetical protein
MNKIENLKEKTRVLRELLERYAKQDNDVDFVLGKMMPLIKEIEAGKIIPPKHDDFGRYFFNVEEQEPWFIKYPELSHAEAEYAAVLQGWELPAA